MTGLYGVIRWEENELFSIIREVIPMTTEKKYLDYETIKRTVSVLDAHTKFTHQT